ncbi:MAG: hypothetical protein N2246_01020 [Candidatus Sumerlaeia bacterium]|nr:hypothetical protein [Candidatus Sumerlaeia bacterium]
MKFLEINGKKIPRVLLGTSPFIGAGQFGRLAEVYYQRFYLQPENMAKIMQLAVEFGWGIQPFSLPNILSALREVKKRYPQVALVFICGLADFDKELKMAVALDATAVGTHAMITDRLPAEQLNTYVDKIKQHNLLGGFATHTPARTLPLLAQTSADFVMIPLNKAGKLMGSNAQLVSSLIKDYPKPIIAKKTLAAGTLHPPEALEYVVNCGVAGVCLGVVEDAQLLENHKILTDLNFI